MRTLDLQVVEGELAFRDAEDKIVNETLVKYLDIKDPIGKAIPTQEGSKIVAVVKDFTCASFKQEIPPVIISYAADAHNLLIDYGKADIDILLPKIKTEWSKTFPDNYFDYKIIQQDLMQKYAEETLFYKVVLSASVISMIISCFGMFALSWAVIRSRAKEMGIRKILGASVANILGLLTVSFAKRLVLAFVLAAPAGYYLMNLWLSRFVYKAPIDSWVFVFTGISLAAIAVFTLGIQTLKASLSSPLEEIKE
jgi:putative ABC transport system permease protein